MECKKEENLERCNCPYSCDKRGICCDCLHKHLANDQLPACCFPDDVAATHERSFKKFVELHRNLLD